MPGQKRTASTSSLLPVEEPRGLPNDLYRQIVRWLPIPHCFELVRAIEAYASQLPILRDLQQQKHPLQPGINYLNLFSLYQALQNRLAWGPRKEERQDFQQVERLFVRTFSAPPTDSAGFCERWDQVVVRARYVESRPVQKRLFELDQAQEAGQSLTPSTEPTGLVPNPLKELAALISGDPQYRDPKSLQAMLYALVHIASQGTLDTIYQTGLTYTPPYSGSRRRMRAYDALLNSEDPTAPKVIQSRLHWALLCGQPIHPENFSDLWRSASEIPRIFVGSIAALEGLSKPFEWMWNQNQGSFQSSIKLFLKNAIQRGQPEIAKFLLSQITGKQFSDYFSDLLIQAIQSHQPEMLGLLLIDNTEHTSIPSATITVQQHEKSEPLPLVLFAAQQGAHEALDVFISHGFDLKCTDAKGNTALHFAVQNPLYYPTVLRLLHNDLDPNQQNAEGTTALHIAAQVIARGFHHPALPLLLQYGADPALKNHVGEYAIDALREAGSAITRSMLTPPLPKQPKKKTRQEEQPEEQGVSGTRGSSDTREQFEEAATGVSASAILAPQSQVNLQTDTASSSTKRVLSRQSSSSTAMNPCRILFGPGKRSRTSSTDQHPSLEASQSSLGSLPRI